jgi:transcription elongation factor Elf1
MPTTKHFVCKTCDHEFDSPAGLGQHVGIAHGECAVCGETFDDGEGLDEHTQASH